MLYWWLYRHYRKGNPFLEDGKRGEDGEKHRQANLSFSPWRGSSAGSGLQPSQEGGKAQDLELHSGMQRHSLPDPRARGS